MDLNITDKELADLKDRILRNAEIRLTDELVSQMRSEIVRETMRFHVRPFLIEKLTSMVKEHFTVEKIRNIIEKTIEDMGHKSYGDSAISKELKDSIYRVVSAHGEAVHNEIKNLLFMTLNRDFYHAGSANISNRLIKKYKIRSRG